MFCWLCCLSKWGVGPFKKEAIYLCRDSRAGLESLTVLLLSRKTWEESVHNGTHLILMRWWTIYCQLLTLSVLYIQSISPFHQCDKLDIYYFTVCTHGLNCENDRQSQAGGVTWLAVEKLSIIAWKVFTPWLVENISMKYSPDSE